jgi:rare lipoprotein A
MKAVPLFLSLFIIVLIGCSQAEPTERPDNDKSPAGTAEPAANGSTEEGMAAHYTEDQEGAQTASGEIIRNDALTAAHKTLEFGTQVRVTNLENGKTVDVIINDRGPYAEGFIIDVSYSAAQALDMIASGTVRARIEVLE